MERVYLLSIWHLEVQKNVLILGQYRNRAAELFYDFSNHYRRSGSRRSCHECDTEPCLQHAKNDGYQQSGQANARL